MKSKKETKYNHRSNAHNNPTKVNPFYPQHEEEEEEEVKHVSHRPCNTTKAYGTFVTTKPLTVIGSGNLGYGTIIPLDYQSPAPVTTPDAFSLNTDGTVGVLVSGVYIINAKLQLACGSGASWVLSVNGGGVNVPYYNEGGGTGNGTSIITNMINLCAGDLLSLSVFSSGKTSLSWGNQFDPQIEVTTAALRLIKVADYECDPKCHANKPNCLNLCARGTFTNYNKISLQGSGRVDTGTIIPLLEMDPAPINTPKAFTLNEDGTITINAAGIYMVNAKLQVACGSGALWGVFVNNGGINVPYYNESGVTGPDTGVISNILSLCVGDVVSIGLISKGTTTLSWGNQFDQNKVVSTLAVRLVKIDEYDCKDCGCDNQRIKSHLSFSNTYATFGTTKQASIVGSGNVNSGTTIPLDYISPAPISTEEDFSLQPDGNILILEPGIYMVDAKIQVASDCGASWGIQVNDSGINVPYYNAGGVTGNKTSSIANIMSLSKGDLVSLGIVSEGTTNLNWGDIFDKGTGISTAALRLIKIDDLN